MKVRGKRVRDSATVAGNFESAKRVKSDGDERQEGLGLGSQTVKPKAQRFLLPLFFLLLTVVS